MDIILKILLDEETFARLHFYRMIIFSHLILINDSIANFSSYRLRVGLIFHDYLESREIPLILGWIFARRAKVIRVREHHLEWGGIKARERERMKNRKKNGEKSAKEKEGENRWRRQVQRWPRHVACQISIYRATKMTKLKRTVRFRWPTANHMPSGLRRFSLADLFTGIRWNIFTVESQIKANPTLGSVPARNATNFVPLNRDGELCGKHGDSRRGKY